MVIVSSIKQVSGFDTTDFSFVFFMYLTHMQNFVFHYSVKFSFKAEVSFPCHLRENMNLQKQQVSFNKCACAQICVKSVNKCFHKQILIHQQVSY